MLDLLHISMSHTRQQTGCSIQCAVGSKEPAVRCIHLLAVSKEYSVGSRQHLGDIGSRKYVVYSIQYTGSIQYAAYSMQYTAGCMLYLEANRQKDVVTRWYPLGNRLWEADSRQHAV